MPYYNKYKKLQKYINGVPVEPAEYQKGDLISSTTYFESMTACDGGNVPIPTDNGIILCNDGLWFAKYETDADKQHLYVTVNENHPIITNGNNIQLANAVGSAQWLHYSHEKVNNYYYIVSFSVDENKWDLERKAQYTPQLSERVGNTVKWKCGVITKITQEGLSYNFAITDLNFTGGFTSDGFELCE